MKLLPLNCRTFPVDVLQLETISGYDHTDRDVHHPAMLTSRNHECSAAVVLSCFSHTCVQSDDHLPALLPEFSPGLLPLHTCTTRPSLAFPSLRCFPAHQPLPWRYSVHFPLLRFFRLASTCTSSPHQGLFVFKPVLFPQSMLIRQFSSHHSSRNSCYPVSFPPRSLCAPCVHLGFMLSQFVLCFCFTVVLISLICQLFVT